MLGQYLQFMKRFTGSLRFKLSFYVGLVMFLTVIAFAYHSISTQERSLLAARIQGALKDSEVIKAAIWNGMMTKDREVIRQIVRTIGKEEGFKAINVYDREGVLQYTSKHDPATFVGKRAEEGETLALLGNIADDKSVRYRFGEGGRVLTVVNPLVKTESCSSAACHAHPDSHQVLGVLEVKLALRELRAQMADNARRIVIFACFLFVLVSSMSGLGVIFMVSRPVRKLRKKAESISRGEYVADTPLQGTNSIAVLSRTLDEMGRQIAERERQIDQSRRMYKELFEKVPCYLTVVSPDYRVVRANSTFQRDFGDQVGTHCFRGFKGSEEKCSNCPVEKTFADGASHRSEEVWSVGGQDKKAYVIVNTSPIFDAQGKVTEVLEMAVDVTRVERLQTELRQKERQFKNLFDNVPCYLTVVDRTFRIAFHNNMFADAFGHSWGEHCFKAYKGKDHQCDNCPVEKTFADGLSHSSEEVWHGGEKDMHIIVRTSPITNEKGEIVAVMEMCTNVTELKLLENELAILGETIAGTSHTVKNILSGLEGGVYVVDSGLKNGKQDRVRAGWLMVKKNVGKVSELVKDILYASKERVPEYRECNPGVLLSEVFELYEGKAGAEGIDLVKDFPNDMGVALLDPNGIHNALSNLIFNAIGACAASARKERHHIVLAGRRENGKIIIQVSDDGIGMSDEVKENLFKRFYSTKGSKGTGLGLLVTRKIVEEHGGRITCASRLGEGTTFMAEIPLRPPEGPPRPQDDSGSTISRQTTAVAERLDYQL
jgi:histidine kinase